MKPMRSLIILMTAGLAGLAAACGGDTTAPSNALVLKLSGDSQLGFPGDTLAMPIQVAIQNAAGVRLAGVSVHFSADNALVYPATVVTDANGVAAASAVVGLNPSFPSSASASVGNHTAIFTFGIKDPCHYPSATTIGATIDGVLTGHDCAGLGDGTYLDAYRFTVDTTEHVHYAMTATSPMDAFLFIADTTGWSVAANDDADSTTKDAAVDVVLPPGIYEVWANTSRPNQVGSYEVTSSGTSPDIGDCNWTFIRTGVSAHETLPGQTCRTPVPTTAVADHWGLVSITGDSLRARATAAGFPVKIRIYENMTVVDSAVAGVAGDTVIAAFVVPANRYGAYVIQVSSASGADAGGGYELSVTRIRPHAAGSAAAAVRAPELPWHGGFRVLTRE